MTGSTEHRRAPRRDVVEIRRMGGWGSVEYQHVLSCGHIENRARASSAPKLACVWCLRAETKEIEMAELSKSPTIVDDLSDGEIASIETEIRLTQASIASFMGIDTDAVDVVVKDIGGNLKINYAQVFLSAKDVRRIAGRNS
jgi:hypothetical protein